MTFVASCFIGFEGLLLLFGKLDKKFKCVQQIEIHLHKRAQCQEQKDLENNKQHFNQILADPTLK
jgi:hypothetical protein